MKKIPIIIIMLLAFAVSANAANYHNEWVMIGSAGGVASADGIKNYAIINQSTLGEITDGKYINKAGLLMAFNPFEKPENGDIQLPRHFELSQNYPNPFNPATTIKYALPIDSDVRLEVYNLLGQKVETLIDGKHHAGYHTIIWNGNHYASGIYFYAMHAGDNTLKKRMTLLK
ncbi:MAG: T9SS type A sorting domain-containing protein [candidate division Zixibacteria bacterium]|nr:T9SS type A sorting domain-containing protein [candidate division Zixibacteria bacterium]